MEQAVVQRMGVVVFKYNRI